MKPSVTLPATLSPVARGLSSDINYNFFFIIMLPEIPDWADEMNCAVTVCDADCKIIYMNGPAKRLYASHGDLIGYNLMDCHSERSRGIISDLLATGGVNCYTIHKKGQKKMIYQTAWRRDGKVAGLVEISMVIPEEIPDYIRQ